MPTENQCDCSRLELLEEKLENCNNSQRETCEKERDNLKTLLETTKKKLVLFQILCAIALTLLGKEGASEAINYFTQVETAQVPLIENKEVTLNDEQNNPMLDGPFRIQ